MDKPDFLHKLKGLPAFQTAEQGLRLARTLTGQKNGGAQVARFRTFDPVDMHGLVHSGGQFAGRHDAFRTVWQCPARQAPWSKSSNGPGVSLSEVEKNFRRGRQHETAPQVYNQKQVYKIVVVVNGGTLLWISQVFPTRSGVYVAYKPVGLPCVCLREKMNKNSRRAKRARSAQSIPVDIQKLIHSCAALTIW